VNPHRLAVIGATLRNNQNPSCFTQCVRKRKRQGHAHPHRFAGCLSRTTDHNCSPTDNWPAIRLSSIALANAPHHLQVTSLNRTRRALNNSPSTSTDHIFCHARPHTHPESPAASIVDRITASGTPTKGGKLPQRRGSGSPLGTSHPGPQIWQRRSIKSRHGAPFL
jgi:hypothetical protein